MIRRPAALIALLAAGALSGCGAASGASGHSTSTSTRSRARTTTAAATSAQRTYSSTGGLKTVRLQSGAHQRTYLLYVPPGDTTNHPLPLVLVFHGADDTAANTVNETDLLGIAEHSHNMILVFAQGYDDTWNEGTGRHAGRTRHTSTTSPSRQRSCAGSNPTTQSTFIASSPPAFPTVRCSPSTSAAG